MGCFPKEKVNSFSVVTTGLRNALILERPATSPSPVLELGGEKEKATSL